MQGLRCGDTSKYSGCAARYTQLIRADNAANGVLSQKQRAILEGGGSVEWQENQEMGSRDPWLATQGFSDLNCRSRTRLDLDFCV